MRVFLCCNLANILVTFQSFCGNHFIMTLSCHNALETFGCEKEEQLYVNLQSLWWPETLNPLHIPTCGKGGGNNVFPLCSTLKVLLIHLQSSSHPFNCCAYIGLILFEQLSHVRPLLFWCLHFSLDKYKFHWNLWQFSRTKCPFTFTAVTTVLLCWCWMLEAPTKAFQFSEAG